MRESSKVLEYQYNVRNMNDDVAKSSRYVY